MITSLILLFIGVILGVAAQLSLKHGIKKANIDGLGKEGLLHLCTRMFFNIPVAFGFVAYGVSLLLWLVVLSKLELSYAYPMVSSGYFFVALGSKYIFKEEISLKRWLAIGIIILGVVVVGIS